MIEFKRLAEKNLPILACIFRGRRLRAAIPNLENRLQLAAIRERVRAREHFDDQTSQAPDVGFARVRGLLDDFGSHPEDGALERGTVNMSTFGGRLEEGGGFDPFRDAEVGDFDAALVVNKNIGAFDVAVDDIPAVKIR